MNHPREKHQHAKQDVNEESLADAPFESDGHRRQEDGEQDQDQLVHGFLTPVRWDRLITVLTTAIWQTLIAPRKSFRIKRMIASATTVSLNGVNRLRRE